MSPVYLLLTLLWCILLAGMSCTPPRQQRALIRMMPDQAAYFKEHIIRNYEREASSKVTIDTYASTDSIEDALNAAVDPVSVVKIPFDKAMPLLRKGVCTRLDSFLSPEELEAFRKDYLMTSMGAVDGHPCLIPRKFETRIMVYCRSKVADAVAVWHTYKAPADSFLALCNGFGLPAGYTLEDDPEKWDYYDLYMVGWVWAHTVHGGVTMPRIGFRGKRYSGTTQRLYDRIYQLGGDTSSITTMQGDAVVDALYWEALYTAGGIYNPRMWSERWSGADIWKAFETGDVFLSFMTQLDCFFIHGTGSDNLNGYLKNPDDMAVATIPRACSVDIDASGVPLRTGSKAISTGGWWWGIPANATDPRAAWELILSITSTRSQIQECSRFGMIPVRKNILGDMAVMFGGGWISGVYDVSFKQLVANGYTVLPGHRYFNDINTVYLDMIDDILVGRNWAPEGRWPEREYIAARVRTTYQPRTQRFTSQ